MGIENGIIEDARISFDNTNVPKSSVRFSSGINANCPTINHVLIDLGRIMTIKAIAFRSMTNITKITFDYGIKAGETLIDVEKSARNKPEKRQYRVSVFLQQIFAELKIAKFCLNLRSFLLQVLETDDNGNFIFRSSLKSNCHSQFIIVFPCNS